VLILIKHICTDLLTHWWFTKNNHVMSYELHFISTRDSKIGQVVEMLTSNGFHVKTIENFSDAIDILHNSLPDVILIDTYNARLSALELCISIKSLDGLKNSVVIILSDKDDDGIELSFFNSGADDFMKNPFRTDVLLKRIKVKLKKPEKPVTIIQEQSGDLPLKIDRESYSVSLGETLIQLSRKEFELLHVMATSPNKMFDREELFRLVWKKSFVKKNDRTLDVHICRLRQKIGSKFIAVQKGIGYRFLS
jgi:two-component system alkaline phosphatase synthesis response regulator PhoP